MLAFNTPLLAAAALLTEAAFGYPGPLLRRVGHPVIWAGAAIAWLDHTLNCGRALRVRGVGAVAALMVLSGGPAWAVQAAALHWLPRLVAYAILAVLASSLLAQRSLWTHVRAVETGLRHGLAAGRAAVSHIVGRNPASLDAAGVARAAVESLAENFSDGIVAPALWCAVLGLPGMAMYKAINTADSMIGHRTPRHEGFGWGAARLDDLVNLPASRLTALLIAGASGSRAGPATPQRHAGRWQPPLAQCGLAGGGDGGGARAAPGWATGLWRRAGGRCMDGRWPIADAASDDIGRALTVYRRACAGWVALLGLLAMQLL